MADRKIRIEIVVDADGAIRKMRDLDGETEKVEKRVRAVNPVLGELNGMIAKYASAAVIGAAIRGSIQYADDLQVMSQRTQITTRELQRLSFAAGQNGSDIQSLTSVIGAMSDRIASGDQSARRAIQDLGLDFGRIRAMRPEDGFKAIGRELAEISDISKRIQLAKDLGGPQGLGALPVWISDMETLGDQAERFGLVVGKDTVEAAAKFDSAWTGAVMGVKAHLMDLITLGPRMQAAFANTLPGRAMEGAGMWRDLLTGGGPIAPPGAPGSPRPRTGGGPLAPPSADDAMKEMDGLYGKVEQELLRLNNEIKKKLAEEHEELSKFIISQNEQRIQASLSYFEQDFTMLSAHLVRKRDIELQAAEMEFTDLAHKNIARLAIEKNYQAQLLALRSQAQTQLLRDIDGMEIENDRRQKGLGMTGTLPGDWRSQGQADLDTQFGKRMEDLIKKQEQAFMMGLSNEVERLDSMKLALENEYVVAMNNAQQATLNNAQTTAAAAGANSMQAMAADAVAKSAGNAGIELFNLGKGLDLVTQRMAVGVAGQGAPVNTNGVQFGNFQAAWSAYNARFSSNSGVGAIGGGPAPDFLSWAQQMGYASRAFGDGGIIDRPTLALMGERGEREFVIPESKMGGMGGVTVIVQAQGATFENDRALDRLADKIQHRLAAKFGQGTRLPGRA